MAGLIPGTQVNAELLRGGQDPLLKVGGRLFQGKGLLTTGGGTSLAANVKTSSSGQLTLNVAGQGVVFQEVSLSEMLAAKGIPQTGPSLIAAELLLSMGREINVDSLKSLLAELPQLVDQFGKENLRSIIMLRLLGLPVTAGSLELGSFLLSSGGAQFMESFTSLFAALPNLLGKLLGRNFSLPEVGNFRLTLSSSMQGQQILSLLTLLGYQEDNPASLNQVLRLLKEIMKEKSGVEEGDASRQFRNIIDSQKLLQGVDGAPLHLVFPFVDGEKQGQANLTYSKTNEQHLLELHLDLDSLGPLRVKFLYEKTLSLTFYTSLDSSQQIIAQQLPELNERLTAAGLSMERLDVFKVAEKLLAIPLLPLSIESSTPTHLDTLA